MGRAEACLLHAVKAVDSINSELFLVPYLTVHANSTLSFGSLYGVWGLGNRQKHADTSASLIWSPVSSSESMKIDRLTC